MHCATRCRVLPGMRPLLASALFALGCSFALAALRGGESALAAVTLMAACSTGAAGIRPLRAGQLVDDPHKPRGGAPDPQPVLRLGLVFVPAPPAPPPPKP